MKIAIIHDWFRVNAGSEKVVKEMLQALRDHEIKIYTLFNTLSVIDQKEILGMHPTSTTLLQYLPSIDTLYRYLLPVLPWFARRIHPAPADVYVSSSHAVAKGFAKRKGSLHICYCHTPMRYAWYLMDDYLKDSSLLKRTVMKLTIPYLRKWDLKCSAGVDYFIANSKHIQEQIKTIYARQAEVIYPPVMVDKFKLNPNPRMDFYLAVGRFVSHKKIDIIIHAFKSMKHKKLVLIGNGYDAKKIKQQIADSPNIVWLGYQHDDELILYMQNARACIFASKEDFGIMCVESQATGTPVLTLNYGGYRESVIEGQTGYFFDHQKAEDICDVVEKFEAHPLTDHEAIRQNALRFDDARFRKAFQDFVYQKVNQAKQDTAHGE